MPLRWQMPGVEHWEKHASRVNMIVALLCTPGFEPRLHHVNYYREQMFNLPKRFIQELGRHYCRVALR